MSHKKCWEEREVLKAFITRLENERDVHRSALDARNRELNDAITKLNRAEMEIIRLLADSVVKDNKHD